VAGTSIGAAVGALSAGFLSDRFGRKSMLIADAAIFAAGAILSAITWHAAVLLAARTLIGLAIGADSAIATAYSAAMQRLLAEAFLATEARTVAVLETVQVRFDVASITVTPGGVVSVHVFEDAF